MRRWLILFACGLTGISSPAQVPDPGVIAEASAASAAVSVPAPAPKESDKVAEAPAPAAPATPAVPAAPTAASQEVVPDDGGIPDTLNTVAAKPAPDAAEKMPACFTQIEYWRKHHDGNMAIVYLRQVVTNKNLSSQDRSRAIVELADCLTAEHQEAEALCWLKIWIQLYPTRPEFGAVAFRIGTMYTQMGLPDLARDAYYLTLAHTINDGQVQSAEDLKEYTRLTVGTLWALAANEYKAGQWTRAAELFSRYRTEATTGTPLSLEKAAFLEADCYYQSHDADKALSLYEDTLGKHPFNALAPEARLRLYHLYVMKGATQKAEEDLEALAWTVRTVWPKDETYWQKETAQMLFAVNKKNIDVLPPLFQESSKLSHEGKTWQEALNHYDALVGYEAITTQGIMDSHDNSSGQADVVRHHLQEEDDLIAMNRNLNQLLPPPPTASNL
jgi:outer membrane protein assembly factor BamD (BamD/ComL family)